MLSRAANAILHGATIGLLIVASCKSADDENGSAATSDARLTLIAPESRDWSHDDAVAKLGDEQLAVSAAVRLVRLAEESPLCAPEALTDESLRRLRVLRLNDTFWAVGMRHAQDRQQLRVPFLILADGGGVMPLADGPDEEMLVLHVAPDPDLFPHVAVQPTRVLIIEDDVETAIALATRRHVRFELREREGFSYVALVLLSGEEVAMYRWDPYELVFLGPAIDALPDPPGGKFKIDLDASTRMEPMGGEIPAPEPIEQEPPRIPITDDWMPA